MQTQKEKSTSFSIQYCCGVRLEQGRWGMWLLTQRIETLSEVVNFEKLRKYCHLINKIQCFQMHRADDKFQFQQGSLQLKKRRTNSRNSVPWQCSLTKRPSLRHQESKVIFLVLSLATFLCLPFSVPGQSVTILLSQGYSLKVGATDQASSEGSRHRNPSFIMFCAIINYSKRNNGNG